MKATIRQYIPLLMAFGILSCCHGYWVAVQNDSKTAKVVNVTNVPASEMQSRRFVYTNNLYSGFIFTRFIKRKIRIVKDSAENAYSFVLPTCKRAFIGGGLGGPDARPELIIIDEKDTIPMSGNKQTIRKENWLTYTTSYTNILK